MFTRSTFARIAIGILLGVVLGVVIHESNTRTFSLNMRAQFMGSDEASLPGSMSISASACSADAMAGECCDDSDCTDACHYCMGGLCVVPPGSESCMSASASYSDSSASSTSEAWCCNVQTGVCETAPPPPPPASSAPAI